MRILEWIAEDRVDSEAAADRAVIAAIAESGHEEIRVLPSRSESDPARPVRETAGVRRLPWNPRQARWYEAGEVDAICASSRGRGIDLVWARGRDAWRAATRAAARLEAPLWIELGSIVEAAALSRPPRGVDLLLTVASAAEMDCLPVPLRDRLVTDVKGEPLLVPPAISEPPERGRLGVSASGPTPSCKIVLAHPGRRPNAHGQRLLRTVIERVHARNRDRRHASANGLSGDPPIEVFLEDPLGDRPAIRRLLRRLGVDVPTPDVLDVPKTGQTSDKAARIADERIVRIPPLGRCRGVLGEGDALIAIQPLLRQRPAVIEALAAGAVFASPTDPELASWFGGDAGGIDLPLGGNALDRETAVDALLDAVEDDARRRNHAAAMRRRLAPLLTPRTRVDAVAEVLSRVSAPHQIKFFHPTTPATSVRPPSEGSQVSKSHELP